MATVPSAEGAPVLKWNVYSSRHGLVSPLAPNLLRIAGRVGEY
jgi:hypothetical protein